MFSKSRNSTARSEIRFRLAEGFTLVELLVVIAIIGILVALLLPAVQAAREAARRSQCMNQLKQISLAFLLHESTHKHFPTGGWGYNWCGDPDRGFGIRQHGGWGYNILPYVEEQSVYDLGKGLVETTADKKQLIAKRLDTLIGIFNCPSRRAAQLYPFVWGGTYPLNSKLGTKQITKCDYAANVGDNASLGETDPGPSSTVVGDREPPQYLWRKDRPKDRYGELTGVTFQRSEVPLSAVEDGASNTYMVGERHLNPDHYSDGQGDDDDCLFVGFDNDTCRMAYFQPSQDTPGGDYRAFGSVHSSNFHMAMCDGSVQAISYDIDVKTHRALGNRKDGKPLENAN